MQRYNQVGFSNSKTCQPKKESLVISHRVIIIPFGTSRKIIIYYFPTESDCCSTAEKRRCLTRWHEKLAEICLKIALDHDLDIPIDSNVFFVNDILLYSV